MKMHIDCKTATKIISQKEEGRLSLKQRIQLIYHFYICSVCKLFYKQNKVLIKSVPLMQKKSSAVLSPIEKQQMIEVLETVE
ncbi:MAG: hypothetical protein MUE72_00140 [Chitinophagaceae bacterium]|jgi:hypothetical protein|nr:hypothetical protein [Chitinophagaceae bacterium]